MVTAVRKSIHLSEVYCGKLALVVLLIAKGEVVVRPFLYVSPLRCLDFLSAYKIIWQQEQHRLEWAGP